MYCSNTGTVDSSPAPGIYEGASKSFRTESITKYKLTTLNTRWEAKQMVMAAKPTRLTHKIAIQLHLVAESCTICSSSSRRPVRKLLDTPSYVCVIALLGVMLSCVGGGPVMLRSIVNGLGPKCPKAFKLSEVFSESWQGRGSKVWSVQEQKQKTDEETEIPCNYLTHVNCKVVTCIVVVNNFKDLLGYFICFRKLKSVTLFNTCIRDRKEPG
jgi:hypothetical protein